MDLVVKHIRAFVVNQGRRKALQFPDFHVQYISKYVLRGKCEDHCGFERFLLRFFTLAGPSLKSSIRKKKRGISK